MSYEQLEDVIAEVGDGLTARISADAISFATPNQPGTSRELVERRSVTPSTAQRLIDHDAAPGLVVSDLIDSSAAELLRANNWSFWDRRGRLRIWLPEIGYRLDVLTPSVISGGDESNRRHPVTGAGGLSLALSLLTNPQPQGVRSIARNASMAPSTISRARQHLVDAALINSDGSPLIPELFWATSDSWRPSLVPVDRAPTGDDWVLAGDAAAAHWGAPTLANRERYYCASQRSLSRFTHSHRIHGESTIEVALAPTPTVVATALDGTAHPVVAALDLSRTQRGREILADWNHVDLPPASSAFEPVWQ
jgi:hypothetical protein